ncbi:hypothetical protein [Streptomyces sp. NPDC090022]|uniref:hypothetical protein n=1 Tax=Streptomyces sp. NPDC090022 TaxID=3365920 RepID=UPI0037F18E1A
MISLLPADPHASTTYVAWARAHDPGAEAVAVAELDAVRVEMHGAWQKPGRCVDALRRRARRLPHHHLPWFWDTVGHRLTGLSARYAGRAYALARQAEQEHHLPVDAGYRRANALLFAARGSLPAKELGDHQAWLSASLEPAAAHREFMTFLTAWAASPADLPADLVRRIRSSARGAGLGGADEAGVLGEVLAGARGKAVPDRVLDAATPLLEAHPPTDAVRTGLLEMFPATHGDADAWLRLLRASGAVTAAAAGRIVPDGGLAAWLGRFAFLYSYQHHAGGGVSVRPMAPHLFAVVAELAPALAAAGVAARIHERHHRRTGLDADLLDACLAHGVPVADPGDQVDLVFWGERSRRDLAALAQDPVFGPRLEGTVHAGLRDHVSRVRRPGSAISLLPGNTGIEAGVHTRIGALLDTLAGGGLRAAEEATEELFTLLDRPTARALDGIEEALAGLDLVGPLARALRGGLPEELGWPALDEAVAGFGPAGVSGVTCTWPVLTVFGTDRAVAVGPEGRRAECSFTVPDDTTMHTVHYAGGAFLVGFTRAADPHSCDSAFWAHAPHEVFTPQDTSGLVPYGGIIDGALGFQFESADGGGRHDGERVLRPGDRHGIADAELQLGDGARIWSGGVFRRDGWRPVDPHTGEQLAAAPLPDFPGRPAAADGGPDGDGDERGMELFTEWLTLAPLPAGRTWSPLGQRDALVGCRVLNRTGQRGPSPREFLLEGIDGRKATFRATRPGRRPWGIAEVAEGAERGVLEGCVQSIRCHAASDGSLLWEVRGFPDVKHDRRERTPAEASPLPFPPPAFWHLLAPRDAATSAALRAAGDGAAARLLAAAVREAGREGPEPAAVRGQVLPGVREPVVAAAVLRAARRAAAVLRRREELSRKVALLREDPAVTLPREASDTALTAALHGLLHDPDCFTAAPSLPHPATLTAIAADGLHLRGALDDERRRLAPPAPPADWTVLTGSIDAAAWRAVTAPTDAADRAALEALLAVWSGQPFAEAGRTWRTGRVGPDRPVAGPAGGAVVATGRHRAPVRRFVQRAEEPVPEGAEDCRTVTVVRDDAGRLARLLDLLAARGPLAAPAEAVTAFSRRTGARRAVAALALGGLPRAAELDAHTKRLASAPFRATGDAAAEYEAAFRALGAEGRREVLAAGLPEDPAGLWEEPGAMVAAAERMAEVWVRRLGARAPVDDALADALEAGLGLGRDWAGRLASGPADEPADEGAAGHGWTLVRGGRSGVDVHRVAADGTLGERESLYRGPHLTAASAVVWALTERPVGDPAVAGATALYERLRERLRDPALIVPAGAWWRRADPRAVDAYVGPRRYPVAEHPERPADADAPEPVVHDDGLLLLSVPDGEIFLRPAALGDPERLARAERLAADHGLPGLARALNRLKALYDGGVARMVHRAAHSPVPAGRYEADPRRCAPGLVAEVAAALAVGADAAALYLQLLALPRPTDRHVREWNGWTAARHKAVQAELVASGAVVADRRPRAGRTAFVPGPWTEFKAPHLPLETAKLEPLLAVASYGKEPDGPYLRLLPPLPLHELFGQAWRTARGN